MKEKQVIRGKVFEWSYRPKDIEGTVNQRMVLDLYIKPSRRPLYSLPVLF
jgi:hypothetical protein